MREYTGNNRNLWKPRGIEDSISCVKALKIRTTFKCCDDKIQQDHILILVIVYQFSILVLKKMTYRLYIFNTNGIIEDI